MTDQPKILYKYKDFENSYSKRVLTHNELFLSSPKSFNDPFDCRIPPCLKLLDSDEKLLFYADRILNRQKDKIIALGKNFEEVADNYRYRLINETSAEQENIKEITFDVQDKILGILSLTPKWNDILMWSHYGNFHKGICYGFDLKALQDSNSFSYGGFVSYSQEFPMIDPIKSVEKEAAILQTHYKALNWQYEEEYRLVKYYEDDLPQFSEKRILKIPDEFFKELIIGCNFPKDMIPEILKIANEKRIPVYQSKMIDWKFSLERDQIN